MISGPYFINLDYRRDRRFQVETEFNRLGIDSAVRVSAIFDKDGATGCLQSHIIAMNDDPLKMQNILLIYGVHLIYRPPHPIL